MPNNEPNEPLITDRRAGKGTPEEAAARTERLNKERAASLYTGRDEGETRRLEQVSPVRNAQHRWKHGEDPHDPEADPESGWEYVKLEAPENEAVHPHPFEGMTGPDSGVRCFRCKSVNYRVVDERTPLQMAVTQPDLEHGLAMNRPIDFRRMPGALALLCPQCEHFAQVATPIVSMLAAQQKGREHV